MLILSRNSNRCSAAPDSCKLNKSSPMNTYINIEVNLELIRIRALIQADG